MKKFVLILLIIHCSLLFAQQPIQEWVARIPGPSNDAYGPFLQVDKQGNSYIAGTHVINDSINILCAKYNTAGAQQWATLYKYPGYAYIQPTGLAIDSSGNAYVISDYGPSYTLPYNGLIVKFNSLTGSPLWARTYIGQYGWSAFRGIKIDRLNNICITGWSDSSHLVIKYDTGGDTLWVRKYHPPACREVSRFACTVDDSLNIIFTGIRTHYYFNGSYDSLLVVKYSSSGVMRWESTYSSGATNANWGAYITADQNGNIYAGGGTTPTGYAVFLTLKYDRNGVRQWTAIYDAPGSGDNNLRGIAMDRINNAFFVSGGAVTNGVQMATTIKYNPATGDSIWVRQDTGIYKYGEAHDIKVDTLGNSYIAGVSSSTGSGAPVDILTIKYSQTGVRNWIMSYNGPYNGLDIGRALGLDQPNNVYVFGTSQSGFQLSDYVLIKYNQLSGIIKTANNIPDKFYLNNYPNPFNSQTEINFGISINSVVNVKIYDILGREVDEFVNSEELKAGEYKIRWNAINFSSGVYFYRIEAGDYMASKKMVLIK